MQNEELYRKTTAVLNKQLELLAKDSASPSDRDYAIKAVAVLTDLLHELSRA